MSKTGWHGAARAAGRDPGDGVQPRLETLESRTLLSARALDPRFGVGGQAVIPLPSSFGVSAATVNAIAVQGDKAVLAGVNFGSPDGLGDFAVVRLNKDGSPDQTFGTGGAVNIDFGGQDIATAVAVQGDKILVAGFSVNFNTDQQVMAVARLNRDGSLDRTFGTGGEATITFTGADSVQGIALEGSKIVVAGNTFVGNTEEFAVARLNANGSLDQGFGTGGEVTVTFGQGQSFAAAGAIQANRILVAGSAGGVAGSNYAVAALTDTGSLDSSFGSGGKVVVSFNGGGATSTALQGNKIVLAGSTFPPGVISDFGVVRLNADGSLDASFGSGGKVAIPIQGEDFASGVVVQGDKILVAGTATNLIGASDFAVARLNGDGSLDQTFGTGGIVTTDFGGGENFASGIALLGNDILVAGGTVDPNTFANDIAVTAYLNS